MMAFVSRLWREPLLHFLLLGAALFFYYDLAGENVEAPPKRIHVERGQIEQLAANFERTWSRPPTPDEREALIESHVREEVFYREALAMGLDRDDPLVRRRLRMKLEFMLEDLATQDVDDARLNEYLQQNSDRFRSEAELSFILVFLDPAKRAQLNSDAAELLKQLNDGADPDSLGDPTLVPNRLERARENDITRLFGEAFTDQVVSLPLTTWSGPIKSPFGAHLVRIDKRVDAGLPALSEIRDEVLREYQVEQRALQKNLVYDRLREDYEVSVESLDAGSSSGAAGNQ